MEIGKFSEKTNLSIDTLRYYDKIGLLVPKRINNIRDYDEKDLEKALGISTLKNSGFTLVEIEQLFKLDKDLDKALELDEKTKEKVLIMLELLKRKQGEVLQKELEILQVKMRIDKMINKVTRLLESGYLFDENEVSLENPSKK